MSSLLVSLSSVRLTASAPERSAGFAETMLGLERGPVADGMVTMRAGAGHQTVVYLPAGKGESAVGLELVDALALATAASRLAAAGFPADPAGEAACRARCVEAAVMTRDASGNAIDLVIRPRRSARRFLGSRDAGVSGLQGVALRSTDPAADARFWHLLGAIETDRVGAIAYLGFDTVHHRIALYPADRSGLLYLELAIASFDHLMQNHYLLQEHQVAILHGPGHEPASGQSFLRFRGPDAVTYAFVHGISSPPDRPRQFTHEDASLCDWGSVCEEIPELVPPDRRQKSERINR